MTWTVYTITALPSAWASVQTVAIGPDGSWGSGPDAWGDPSLLYDTTQDPPVLDPQGRGYWGLMNGGTPQTVQLPAAGLTALQAMSGVTVTSITR
jgi:hypothetical protein